MDDIWAYVEASVVARPGVNCKIIGLAKGESHPRGLGFVFLDGPEEEETEASSEDDEFRADEMFKGEDTTALGASKPKKYLFSTQFQSLQHYIDAKDKIEDRKLKRIATWQDHAFATQNAFNASLAEAFARPNPATAEPFQFPNPQPLPAYPPSDLDVEEVPPPA